MKISWLFASVAILAMACDQYADQTYGQETPREGTTSELATPATTDPVGTPDFEVSPTAVQTSALATSPVTGAVPSPETGLEPGSRPGMTVPVPATTDPVGTPDFEVLPEYLEQRRAPATE